MTNREFIPVSRPDISNAEIRGVAEVLRSGWWTTGPKVTEFEHKVAEYIKDKEKLFAVALNSCTAGLHLSLLALDIKPKDEVIVPTWTFAATAEVVEWLGAKLILCDVDRQTLNIDIEKAERLITPRTR